MKFGSVQNPGEVDFSLPPDHPDLGKVLSAFPASPIPTVHVGCAKWNRQDLKGFYPRGTKDELTYYGKRFNAVELNATFYRNFSPGQVAGWYEKVPEGFRFFPKVNRRISHLKWLSDTGQATEEFLDSVAHFREKLGTIFLQLRDNFSSKHFNRVVDFVEAWPREWSLAVEFRHSEWYNDPKVADELYSLLEENDVANVMVDTAGRRDLLHMRLTNNEAFIRYVGANHASDYTRLEEWTKRLKAWRDKGLHNIHFFIHQNEEKESPRLASHFIKHLNRDLGTNLRDPLGGGDQPDLF